MQNAVVRPADYGRLILITVTALTMRLIVLLLPFRRYQNLLGTHLEVPDYDRVADAAALAKAKAYGDLTDRVCNRLPVGGDCLVSAMTFARYARRQRIPYVIHLGVNLPDKTNPGNQADKAADGRVSATIAAHAWVIVSGETVAGDGEDLDRFRIVSSFCHPSFLPGS